MADPTGVLRGSDVSHHQEGLDVSLFRQDGIDYIVARTAQARGGKYGTTIDRAYRKHKANTAKGGMLFSSYFYLGNGLTPQQNVELHASVEPDRSVPLMLDWENGSGNTAFLHATNAAFKAAGYYVWGTYAPRWYWQAQGGTLAGLPPLVSSRYADNAPGNWDAEYRSTPESYWAGYGGNTVGMLQFTSSGRVRAYPTRSLDLLAYKGSRSQLANWWNPGTPLPKPKPTEGEGDVSLLERIEVKASMSETGFQIRTLNGSPQAKLIVRPPDMDWRTRTTETPVWQGHVYAYGDGNAGIGHDPMFTPGFDPKVISDAVIPLPGALHARYEYSCKKDFILEVHG